MAPFVLAFRAHISAEDGVFLTGNVLQELLDGLRNKQDFDRLQHILEPFPLVPLHRGASIAAAQLRQRCRVNGVQAGPIDCLIAAACIEHGFLLLTADRDFTYIAKHSDLCVLQLQAAKGLLKSQFKGLSPRSTFALYRYRYRVNTIAIHPFVSDLRSIARAPLQASVLCF